MDITILEGTDLRYVLDQLGTFGKDQPYRLRIHQSKDGSGVKIKVNEGMWTPWLGTKDGA